MVIHPVTLENLRNKYIQQKQQQKQQQQLQQHQYLDKTRLVALTKQFALIKQLFALVKQLFAFVMLLTSSWLRRV